MAKLLRIFLLLTVLWTMITPFIFFSFGGKSSAPIWVLCMWWGMLSLAYGGQLFFHPTPLALTRVGVRPISRPAAVVLGAFVVVIALVFIVGAFVLRTFSQQIF